MNSQLPIALHIVGFLASANGTPLTSEKMASVYGTSPVVLRRVLNKLRQAGLVQTQRGVNGGSVLAKSPSAINLREVYESIQDDKSLLPEYSTKCSGTVAPVLGNYLDELFAQAEEALLAKLEGVTVAQMDRVVRRRIMRAVRQKSHQ
ncbi:MAG: Rrf2 family transcriptional regulator [Burkholderiaceae bacterium]